MTASQSPAAFGGSEILGRMTEMFSESDPRLDRVKESVLSDLNNLKKNKDLTSLAANMWKSAETGLKEDLSELDVTDSQKKQVLAEARNRWETAIQPEQMREIMESPEKAALDAYITDLENLPVLKGIMESAQPKAKWEMWLSETTKKMPFLAQIAGTVLSFLGFKKETVDRIMAAMGKGGKAEKAVEQKPAQASAKTAQTPAEQTAAQTETHETEIVLTDNQKAALKPLQDAGFAMDLTKTQEDMTYLTGQNLDQTKIVELAAKSAAETGNLKKIKMQIGNVAVKFRLKDAYILDGDYLQPGQVAVITENVGKIEKTPEKIRRFLDKAHEITKDKTKPEDILAAMEFETLKASA